MKFKNDKTKKLIIPAIGGVLLVVYQIYIFSGKFGIKQMLIVLLTALVALGIILLVDKLNTK